VLLKSVYNISFIPKPELFQSPNTKIIIKILVKIPIRSL